MARKGVSQKINVSKENGSSRAKTKPYSGRVGNWGTFCGLASEIRLPEHRIEVGEGDFGDRKLVGEMWKLLARGNHFLLRVYLHYGKVGELFYSI